MLFRKIILLLLSLLPLASVSLAAQNALDNNYNNKEDIKSFLDKNKGNIEFDIDNANKKTNIKFDFQPQIQVRKFTENQLKAERILSVMAGITRSF